MKAIFGALVIFVVIGIIIGFEALLWILGIMIVSGIIFAIAKGDKTTTLGEPKNMLGGFLKERQNQQSSTYSDATEELFATEIDTEGKDFFFNSHPGMMASEFVVIDFETANTRARSAVSLGITHFNKGNCITKEFLFKPYQTKDFKFSYLHGITEETVKNKPGFEFYWPEIKAILDGKTIFAHNAEFDINVLQTLIEDLKLEPLDYHFKIFCTLEFARRKKLNSKYGITNSLESLCRFYKLPYGKHNGAKDTISTLFVLNELLFEKYIDTEVAVRQLKGKKWNTVPLKIANELKSLSDLYQTGALTDEEFIVAKTKVLK